MEHLYERSKQTERIRVNHLCHPTLTIKSIINIVHIDRGYAILEQIQCYRIDKLCCT